MCRMQERVQVSEQVAWLSEMSIVGGCGAIGLQGEQCNSSRHTDCWTLGQTSQCSGVVTALSALQRACVRVCVSTAQDGLGEKVPRLRPLNFTSGCCLAGSFDQMWKLRSRWRWQRPNCYGFPRSCTWICNPRVERLSPSSSWVPAPCIITLTTSCDHPLPLHTIVQYSYLSLITYIVGSLERVVTMKTVLLSVLLISV